MPRPGQRTAAEGRYQRRYYQQTAWAPKHKQPWTESEDRAVLDREVSDAELAKKLDRSVGAIQHRRHRLTHEETNA